MKSTNYYDTLIEVAEDCPAERAEVPPTKGDTGSVAALQHAMIANDPYRFTSDDVLFEVFAIRQGVPESAKGAERKGFFAKDQACMRASPLGKRYGWGVHHDSQGRVALVAVDSERYRELLSDDSIKKVKAMRSKRA